MKDLLFVKKLHLPVFSSAKPNSKSDEEWEFEHLQVCGFIRQYVEDNIYNHIANEKHAKTLWEKLESLYASKSGNNKLFLLNSFISLKYKEGTSISDHLSEFQGLLDQMSGMGIKFEDELLGLFLLLSLPESWETFRVSITSSAPKGVVSLETAKGGILNEEMRRKAQGTSSQSEVLVTENRGRSQKKEPKGGRENSRSKSKGRYKNMECNYCHKSGHIQKYCYQWRKDNKGKKGKQKQRDREDHDDDRVTTAINDDLVILRDHESINLVSDESMWIVDSGATLHVTPRKEFFTSYTSGDFGGLKMGNDGVAKVIGVGDICLQTNMGMQLLLRDVKHAPDVRFNLISVHMLDDCGYDNHFGSGKWKLSKGNLVVARGEKTSKLYWTKALVARDSVNVIDMKASLWHRRLSHISEKGLNVLAKKDVLPGLKNADLEKCSHCMTDQTIEDIDKVEKTTPEKDVSLSNIDPVRLPVHNLDTIGGDVQNGEPHDYVDDQQLGEEVYIPADNDEENDMSQDENLGEAPESSQVQLRRSNRQRQPSTRNNRAMFRAVLNYTYSINLVD
ncbi:unnamed protein product [Trifolium pratense]|uniref:Uncharacterized protein n=1 Tax=Trifolium pratense TaxID=57577 RepID=A0ACB0I6J9_TRIPR|nr:unnamed protein product [Trifolium pratense]